MYFYCYLDDIAIQQSGGNEVFYVKPDAGTWFHVYHVTMSAADDLAGTLADATMPNLSYNTMLSPATSGFSPGFLYQRIIDGEVVNSKPFRHIGDWLSFPNSEISSSMSDGDNTYISIKFTFTEPITLKYEKSDELRIVLSEDFSSLQWLKVSVGIKIEER